MMILLVEDYGPMLEVAALLLRELGHRVMGALGVEEALDLATRAPVELILIDTGILEKGGGPSDAARLRAAADGIGRRPPIVGYSNARPGLHRGAAPSCFLDGCISKFDPAGLRAILEQIAGLPARSPAGGASVAGAPTLAGVAAPSLRGGAAARG